MQHGRRLSQLCQLSELSIYMSRMYKHSTKAHLRRCPAPPEQASLLGSPVQSHTYTVQTQKHVNINERQYIIYVHASS